MHLGKVLSLLGLAILLAAAPASAGLVTTSETTDIRADEVISDNLIALGRSTMIRGTIEGDLISAGRNIDVSGSVLDNIVAAAQHIRISGPVGSDVLGFSQFLTIEDTVFSDVRGACQDFVLRGHVHGDLVMAGQSVNLQNGSIVGNDLYAAGASVNIGGMIYGKALVGCETLTIEGVVEGDAEVWAENIRFIGDGRVAGNLVWHGESSPAASWANYVGGTISHDPMEWKEKTGKTDSKWPGRFFSLLTALVSGVVLIGFFRPLLEKGLAAFADRPWVRLGVGALGVIVQPIAAVILMVLVLTLPVGLIVLGLYPMFLYMAWILFALVGGTLLFSLLQKGKMNLWLGGLLGIVVLWALALIPGGGLICFVASLFGFGILLHGLFRIFFKRGSVA
ncbi:hypothetical protein KQI63_07080 [bacterium]|nr:hypothetical protein [bacterium]